jgi:DNA-binding NtrC family response regulator
MQTEIPTQRILVVDDEPSVCQSVDKILRRRGHRVEQALTVASALDAIERDASFDLVLADLMMPQAGGVDLLKIVADRWPELPVVIITGYASIASAVEATRLGAVDYLPKPFTPDELLSAVHDAVVKRRLRLSVAPAATTATVAGPKEAPAVDPPMSRMIDVDMPFDEAEVAAATSPTYVQRLTRSDVVVVDFCDLGQRTCKRLKTKGVCKAAECPIVSKQKKTGKLVVVNPAVADPIDVDMPFSAREVAAATSEAYVSALGRGDVPNLSNWPRGRRTGRRILAVDDEAVVVHSIRKSLSRRGFHVDEAFTAYAALARIQSVPYDLVLLDMRMPDVNGLDLLPKIKRQRPDLPVVIVTGYASIDTAVEAIQRGAADYVPKPFTPEELYKVANRALQRHAA